MDSVNFDINDALKHYMSDPASIPTPEADGALVDCENDPESLTDNAVINGVLNPIVDAVAENPDAITRSHLFDSLQFLLKCAPISSDPLLPSRTSTRDNSLLAADTPTPARRPRPLGSAATDRRLRDPDSELFKQSRYTSFLSAHALSKIFDLITSGLATEADVIHHDLESDEQELIAHHKQLLEMYGFLLQWTIAAVETKAAEKSSTTAPTRGRGKPKGKKDAGKDATWDSSTQLETALSTMCKVLRLKLGKIFLTTSERDTFISLLTRPVYMILESEQRVKSTSIRMHAFKVLCIAVKHHGHGYGGSFVTRNKWKADIVQRHKSPSSRT
jgi:condensin complex subunit 1